MRKWRKRGQGEDAHRGAAGNAGRERNELDELGIERFAQTLEDQVEVDFSDEDQREGDQAQGAGFEIRKTQQQDDADVVQKQRGSELPEVLDFEAEQGVADERKGQTAQDSGNRVDKHRVVFEYLVIEHGKEKAVYETEALGENFL